MPEVKEFIIELTEERSAFVKVAADNELRAVQYAREAYNDGTVSPHAFSQRNSYEDRVVAAEDLENDYGLEPEDAVSCSLVDMFPLKERMAKEIFDYLHTLTGMADDEDVIEAAQSAVQAFAAGRVNWEDGPGIDRETKSNYFSKLDEKFGIKPGMGM